MNWRPYALIVFVFIASRLWLWSIGVEYDTYRNTPETTVHIMQMLPTEAMEENVWEAILYDHQQPPLYSLLMWATGMSGPVVHSAWMVLGLLAGIALYTMLSSFGIPTLLSLLVACMWMLSPATMLFENCVIYTHPVACLLIIAAWALQRGHFVTFSVVCAMVTMTRSLFHFGAWLIPVLLLGWLTYNKRDSYFTKRR